jgi:hypothetical protein
LATLATIRAMGKREARARLQALQEQPKTRRKR